MTTEGNYDPQSLELFGTQDCPSGSDSASESLPEIDDSVKCEQEATESLDQLSLIDADYEWKREWQGMPEFIQKDLEPYKTVYVHFENRADMDVFAKLVEQKITFDTKSIWYPKEEIGRFINKRYVDES